MKVSLTGLLLNAADAMPLRPNRRHPQPQGLAFGLRVLHGHLADVKAGRATIDQFFATYVIEETT